MESLTVLLALALASGLKDVGKELVKPLLTPAREQIEDAVLRGYRKAKSDQALQNAIARALDAAGAPQHDEDALLKWGKEMGLARLQAKNAVALRQTIARSVLGYTAPAAPPPEDLIVALRWPRSRADDLARLLAALRQELAGLEDWQPLIAYADEQAKRGLLQDTLRNLKQMADTVTFSDAGAALRVVVVERLHLSEGEILEIEKQYRELVKDEFRMHVVTGLAQVDKAVRLPLDEIYLELGLVPFSSNREQEEEALLDVDVSIRLQRAMQHVEKRVTSALAEEQRLVIVGKPGSGKTTSLKYIAYMLSLGAAGAARLGFAAPLIPIYVRLAEFAESLLKQPTLSLEKFLENYIRDRYPGAPRQDEFLRYALREGNFMVLLDGLDEVGDVGDRLLRGKTLRDKVLDSVQRFAEQRCQPDAGNRIVVTSRLEGYRHGNLAGFTETELSSLRLPDEVQDFLQRWFTAYIREHDPELSLRAAAEQARKERVSPLMGSIMKSSSIQLLSINPLLLTILAVIYETRNTPLPNRRAELYYIVAETLVKNWRQAQTHLNNRIYEEITPGEIYYLMSQLAYWLHENRPGGTMPLEDWRKSVQRLLGELIEDDHLEPYVDEFLRHAREETGLLTERSPGQIGFFHLTLEEYLAAVEMARQGTDKRLEMLNKHWRNTRWQEVLLLTAGELARRGNRDALEAYLNALVNRESEAPEQQGRPAFLAGRALADIGPRSVGRRLRTTIKNALLETAQDLEPEGKTPSLQGRVDIRMRADAADVLDELGYTPDDLYQFIPVPVPGLPSPVYFAKYPVTNAQYARFLDADDFADPELWQNFPKFSGPKDGNLNAIKSISDWGDAGWQWRQRKWDENRKVYPRYWNDPRFGIARPSAPVVVITWYEANAYCKWLSRH